MTGGSCTRRDCVGSVCKLLDDQLKARRSPSPVEHQRSSGMSTLFEVRARRSLVWVALFLSAALLTWLLVH
jgi:hypothetical protein